MISPWSETIDFHWGQSVMGAFLHQSPFIRDKCKGWANVSSLNPHTPAFKSGFLISKYYFMSCLHVFFNNKETLEPKGECWCIQFPEYDQKIEFNLQLARVTSPLEAYYFS